MLFSILIYTRPLSSISHPRSTVTLPSSPATKIASFPTPPPSPASALIETPLRAASKGGTLVFSPPPLPFPFPLPLLPPKSASLTGQNATRPSSPPAIARDPSQTSERRGPIIAEEEEEEEELESESLVATTFPWRKSTALSLPSAVAATAKTPPGQDEGGSRASPAT